MDHVDAGNVLARDAVDGVGQFLDDADARDDMADDHELQQAERDHEDHGDERQLGAPAEDLDHGPDGHGRCLHTEAEARGGEVLHLHDVGGRARDQGRDRKAEHIFLVEAGDYIVPETMD